MYAVEIQKQDSYRVQVSSSKTLERAEKLAQRFALRQSEGTLVYVTTAGVVLTTYTAS